MSRYHDVSILYEANEVCNPWLVKADAIRYWFQSSTRLTRFATQTPSESSHHSQTVSILYEANEVCNTLARSSLLTIRLFQSSTRLTRFATSPGRTLRQPLCPVSILYEANEVCNPASGAYGATCRRFQSSTRLTRFATAPSRKRLQAGGLEAIFARGGIMRQARGGAVGLKWDFPSPGRVRTRTRGKGEYAIQKSSLLYSTNPRYGIGGLHKVAFALARGGLPGPCRRGS